LIIVLIHEEVTKSMVRERQNMAKYTKKFLPKQTKMVQEHGQPDRWSIFNLFEGQRSLMKRTFFSDSYAAKN